MYPKLINTSNHSNRDDKYYLKSFELLENGYLAFSQLIKQLKFGISIENLEDNKHIKIIFFSKLFPSVFFSENKNYFIF